jgi:PAS domain S-box-containing protein
MKSTPTDAPNSMIGSARQHAHRIWANMPLRAKGRVVVAIPLTALLVATGSFYWVRQQNRRAEAWVRHTLEVRETIQSLLTLIVDAQTGTRGYLLTGRQNFLAPYLKAREPLPQVGARLIHLVRDNPLQVERARRVQSNVEEQLRLLTEIRQAALPGRVFDRSVQVLLMKNKGVMDLLRRDLGAMQDEEKRLLTQGLAHAEQVQRRILVAIGLSVAFGLLGGCIAMSLFTSGIVIRMEALSENASRLAQGFTLSPQPSSDDEIGHLDRALQQSGALLEQRDRALREAKGFLEHLILTSPGVIFGAHPESLSASYVSPNVERLLGYTVEEVLGDPGFWPERIHPDERERFVAEIARASSADAAPVEHEYRFRRRDGDYRWLHTVVRLERDERGATRRILGYVLDITERKRAEAEITRLYDDLQKRTIEVEAANEEQKAFNYSVSHDLRSPLRSIDGFSLALLEDYSQHLDDAGRGYLQRIRAASQRMGQLIDDLLQLSRLTRAELRRERVDLTALVRSITDELREREPRRHVEFVAEDGLVAEGDPRLLRVALENLLSNAWKYTGKQECSRIQFGAMKQGDGTAYFVRDNGVGFDMAHADKLFGAFQRLHGMNEFPGTGIGLATVQRIVHRHGGHAWAEAAVGRGATLYFTLGRGEQHD